MTLIDSNILLDIFTRAPDWWKWSLMQLEEAALRGPLLINDVIYAEISVRFEKMVDLDSALANAGVTVAHVPREALFLAGKAFRRYRNASGNRSGVLPDFFIGAHADAARLALLTRDTRRYRGYFPAVTLITPDNR